MHASKTLACHRLRVDVSGAGACQQTSTEGSSMTIEGLSLLAQPSGMLCVFATWRRQQAISHLRNEKFDLLHECAGQKLLLMWGHEIVSGFRPLPAILMSSPRREMLTLIRAFKAETAQASACGCFVCPCAEHVAVLSS